MEENVALDSSKQKQFVKSVKGIKKLINKRNKPEKTSTSESSKPIKNGKVKKRRSTRGLVYLGHIPHGFYENEMSQYFRQFGMVTNVRVIRSKRTGNSKGFAFVEFRDPAVAQVVAETMNNYLMGKRLIKAQYIPPEKQKLHAKRKHWSFSNNPTVDIRRKQKKAQNAIKSNKEDLKMAKNMLSTLNKTKKKLKELGIDYDFFKPVDIPEGVEYKQEEESKPISIMDDKKVKVKKEVSKDNNVKGKLKKENNLLKQEVPEPKIEGKKLKNEKKNQVPEESKVNVKDKKDSKVNLKTQSKGKKDNTDEVQKQKRQKLKDSNVKLLEDFISVEESDGDSDGSLEFDSDEFEKAMGEGDSIGSSDESDHSLDDEITSEDDDDEDEEEEKPPVKQKPIVAVKRKPQQKNVTPPKKIKFEKQSNKKPLNKVVKKKK